MRAMSELEAKEFLKSVSTMLAELSSALEYYVEDDENAVMAKAHRELLNKSKAMEEHFDDQILRIALSELRR
jgi:hypothetical protein